jgi:uncharacterized protein (UPF0212 family)
MTAATTLPGGYRGNGGHAREAVLRPLAGEDVLFLAEECRGLLPAHWVTEALARCVTRLAADETVTREAIRSLTVGDREALLLHLRRLTWGERLRCLLACPECEEQLEVDMLVADLLLSPYGEAMQEHEFVSRQGDAAPALLRFRLPTGADQEAAAELALADVQAAVDLLLRRCMRPDTTSVAASPASLPAALAEQLSGRMAELDPQAEISLSCACPACGGAFSAIFDAASYLREELEAAVRTLYREIHLLAYHYHWSAAEIVRMSADRRSRFLRLLEAELAHGTLP